MVNDSYDTYSTKLSLAALAKALPKQNGNRQEVYKVSYWAEGEMSYTSYNVELVPTVEAVVRVLSNFLGDDYAQNVRLNVKLLFNRDGRMDDPQAFAVGLNFSEAYYKKPIVNKLNTLLPAEHAIADADYITTEQLNKIVSKLLRQEDKASQIGSAAQR